MGIRIQSGWGKWQTENVASERAKNQRKLFSTALFGREIKSLNEWKTLNDNNNSFFQSMKNL